MTGCCQTEYPQPFGRTRSGGMANGLGAPQKPGWKTGLPKAGPIGPQKPGWNAGRHSGGGAQP
jgi:hypothetical protein